MWQAMSFTEAMLKGDEPHIFEGKPIKVGDFIVFKAEYFVTHTYAKILSIDLVAEQPLYLEWYDEDNIKHLSRFSPLHIKSIEVKENLNDAREDATARRRAYAEQTPRG